MQRRRFLQLLSAASVGLAAEPREAAGHWVEAAPGVLGIRPGRPRGPQMQAAPHTTITTIHLY